MQAEKKRKLSLSFSKQHKIIKAKDDNNTKAFLAELYVHINAKADHINSSNPPKKLDASTKNITQSLVKIFLQIL